MSNPLPYTQQIGTQTYRCDAEGVVTVVPDPERLPVGALLMEGDLRLHEEDATGIWERVPACYWGCAIEAMDDFGYRRAQK